MNRPLYDDVDNRDREAQIGSRTNVLSKSFVTDLWMKVINRAIDDIALYIVMRENGKTLSDEDEQNEMSAKGFLFDEDHTIAMDDYLVDVECPKCEKTWNKHISTVVGQDSVCPHCSHHISKKYIKFTLTEDQSIKEISLKDLIALWGVEDMDRFRSGVKKRINEIVEKKLKTYK